VPETLTVESPRTKPSTVMLGVTVLAPRWALAIKGAANNDTPMMMLRRSMAYLLPLAPLGTLMIGIGGAAPYCGRGAPCAPQPPPVRPIAMDFRSVGAEPYHPIDDEKLPFEAISFLLGCSC
jgi:hypothetical protein